MADAPPLWQDVPVNIRAPANIYLRRAQVVLLLVAVVTTIVTTPLGIVLMASGGSHVVAVVSGVLVLAFCASSVVCYVLGSMFLRRGASLVDTQNQFLSAVSHELRTPMTSMRMFLEALLDDRLTDRTERRECLVALRSEMMRLDGLVGRLIDLSRVESGRQPFANQSVEASAIVDDTMRAFAAIRLDAPADVTVDVEPDLRVRGDRSALVQVFVNLLANAWKYGGSPPRIRFRVEAAGERRVAFEVSDNGTGIVESERRRVFGMFERGVSALRRGASGSGVGLAVVNAIVRRHRGRVELDSAPEGGCRFRVLLRRCHDESDHGEGAEQP